MTKQTEALKMAHKSFMQLNERYPRKDNGNGYFDEEIQACKEALEQPSQEPVAWISSGGLLTKLKSEAQLWIIKGGTAIPLYTHPAPSWQGNKEFVGLSDDEIQEELKKMWDKGLIPSYSIVAFARAIEQALKEKNNG